MTEAEVIIVDGIPEEDFTRIVKASIEYAVISLPFTVNRMSIGGLTTRIENTAKGKISEGLLEFFCRANSITLDFESCTTPFYTIDRRDFLFNGLEWDQKNNFLYHASEIYNGAYTTLPALVPDRFSNDQWDKRTHREFDRSSDVGFVFTFMKAANLSGSQRGHPFLSIGLSDKQVELIRRAWTKYQGRPQSEAPFSESKFWEEMSKLGEGAPYSYELGFRPNLVITSYASSQHWPLFNSTPGKKFAEGTIWTKIVNQSCVISALPSFLSLLPQLRQGMAHGRLT